MTDRMAHEKGMAKRNVDPSLQRNETHKPSNNDVEENSIEHVAEKGLPPGIEANDLFNPNGNRPRDVPNGDNS